MEGWIEKKIENEEQEARGKEKDRWIENRGKREVGGWMEERIENEEQGNGRTGKDR
jgi:hypothetical protein